MNQLRTDGESSKEQFITITGPNQHISLNKMLKEGQGATLVIASSPLAFASLKRSLQGIDVCIDLSDKSSINMIC